MEGASEQKPLNIWRVVFETRRVIKSQRRTFLALAFLFLFPSSLAAVLYPLIVKSLSQDETPANKIALFVAYYLFSLFFSPLAISSITYTSLHSFSGEPVKVKAIIKSIAASYFPLLATALFVQLIVFFITLGFALVVVVLGLAASPYLLGFAAAIFASVMLYLQVNWILSSAVVVAESSWGFVPLKRSKTLMKGKRGLALGLSLIFVWLYLLLFWSNNYTVEYAASSVGASRLSTAAKWGSSFLNLTLQFLSTAISVMVVRLYSVILSVVLYLYYRAIEKSSGEHSGEYFSLPVDDDTVASAV